jgi:transcriptional regulator with XRE-family HTH domain/AraC-like DNA-binding protein
MNRARRVEEMGTPKFLNPRTSSGSASAGWPDLPARLQMPPRSRLYSEKPIGVGTQLVESLTDYVGRLAESHLVSAGDLAGRFLSEIPNPFGSLITAAAKAQHANGFYVFGYELNGIGTRALAWVYALEVATSISELQNLTFLPLKGAISERLFKRSRAWCPICFEEWRSNGQIIYEPLLWAIDVCSVCPLHTGPLRHACPTCGRSRPPLPCRFRPGYCDSCGTWLGSVETAANRCDSAPETTQEQIMTSRQVGGLLELLPRLNPDLATHSLRQNLNTYISSAAHGNAQALANHVGPSSRWVRRWANGQAAPQLSVLLRISRALNVPLSSFYEADGPSAANLATAEEAIAAADKRISKPYQRAKTIKDAMLAALHRYPPCRLRDVARGLGYSGPEPLYRMDSSLSRSITKRYREYSQAHLPANTGDQRICEEAKLRELLERSLASDEPVSVRQIAHNLGYARASPIFSQFPSLCRSISKKSAALKKRQQKQIRRHLQRALTEQPAPSVTELSRRFGYTKYILLAGEPALCKRITERHNKCQLQQRAERGKRAAEMMSECPAPSIATVAKRLGVSPGYLRAHFPALAKDMVEQHCAAEATAKDARRRLLFDEALSIATELHKHGVYPSGETVAQNLKSGISGNFVEIEWAARAAREALGIG